MSVLPGLLITIGLRIWAAIFTRPKEPKAGTIQRPGAEEGKPIPAVFGTMRLAPNIIWWGDTTTKPIKGDRRVSVLGVDIQGPRATIGHRYYVGMQGALCWGPVDELVEIFIEGKKLSEEGPSSDRIVSGSGYTTTTSDACTPSLPIARVDAGQLIKISAADLFGGKEEEGGVLGDLSFYFGSMTQNANAYLRSKIQDPLPAWRGLCYAVWEQMYIGTTPYLKDWEFVVRRIPSTLGALAGDTNLSRINSDANPAEILYELWTNREWGLGNPASDLDTISFLVSLRTLHREGRGISTLHHGGNAHAESKFHEIRRQIGASFVRDPVSGKRRLILTRPGLERRSTSRRGRLHDASVQGR